MSFEPMSFEAGAFPEADAATVWPTPEWETYPDEE